MARILGVEESEANMFTRFAYGMVRRKVGKVIMPMKVHAQHLRTRRTMWTQSSRAWFRFAPRRSSGARFESISALRWAESTV